MSPPAAPVEIARPAPHVVLVTLCRPEARNAISPAIARDLERIVRETEADDGVRAVVLTGRGGVAFCAGADLKEVAAGRLGELGTAAGGFAGFVHIARRKPWIAAVDGLALAGGCEIALACDMIIASEDAAFGLPEVTRGLIAGAGGVFRLPRALPRAIALELIATGGRLSASRALAHGLVNAVVPKERTVPEAVALAVTISGNAPVAVRESLVIARQAHDLDATALTRLSDEGQARVMLTEDFREGPRAFMEKRPPRWLGR